LIGLISDFCLRLFLSNAAGKPIIDAARIRRPRVMENPKKAMPMPTMALPIAVEINMTAVFLVDSFSSLLGDNEKIVVLFTAQYEDSFIASAIFPMRNIGVELATKYIIVDNRVLGQFRSK